MRWLIVGLWIALVAEALLLSPAPRPDQGAWIVSLLVGDWDGQEPMVVALFQLMGVWPFALAAALAPRLRRRPVPLWPFVAASMVVGAYALLPGLALGGEPVEPQQRWQQWLRHRGFLAVLGVVTLGLITWGALAGSVQGYLHAFRTEQFVHLMSLDFLALWLTSVLVARREGGPWAWTLLPVVGTLLWASGGGGRR
ncbi:MAG: hypothetical protein KTR31_17915 [Myxococcales bacterium]|nr:hypothetical protein [Myxococcales bacterium]